MRRGTRPYNLLSSQPAGQAMGQTNSDLLVTALTGHVHQHNSRVCREGVCSIGIEREIIRHPDSRTHLDAVSLCLRLPVDLLRSISALRAEGQWHDELKAIYGPLFTAPATDLFEMILSLRCFPGYDPANLIEQLRAIKDSVVPGDRRKHEAGRTAPDGFVYMCPSENCKKPFRKSGHAQNHLRKRHPEYLQLHPNYEPQQSLVDISRSQSTSPVLERRSSKRSQDRHSESRHGSRPQNTASNIVQGLAMSLNDGAEYPDLVSPSPLGLSSFGDADEQVQLTRSPSNGRPSPRQPVTPQPQDLSFTGPDRHSYPQHLTPPIQLSKRVRDPYSSCESIVAMNPVDTHSGERHQRRQSKRLSVSNAAYWQC